VVAIACYTFWAGSLIARQSVENAGVAQENYFPFFTFMQVSHELISMMIHLEWCVNIPVI
jgi:hypothetical protein